MAAFVCPLAAAIGASIACKAKANMSHSEITNRAFTIGRIGVSTRISSGKRDKPFPELRPVWGFATSDKLLPSLSALNALVSGTDLRASDCGTCPKQFVVNFRGSLHHAVRGEILCHPSASGLTKPSSKFAVPQNARHRGADFSHLWPRDHQATLTVFNDLRQRPAPERNRGNLMRHCREQGIIQRFEEGRQQKQIERCIHTLYILHKACKNNSFSQAERFGQRF